MNIGELSKRSGVDARLIRHYESIGLISKATRTQSGYRVYQEIDVNILRFVRRARGLGFPIKEIKKLVSLWKNKRRASNEVKELALSHLKTLELKIAELQDIADNLRLLADHCHGDDRPECPILNNLSDE